MVERDIGQMKANVQCFPPARLHKIRHVQLEWRHDINLQTGACSFLMNTVTIPTQPHLWSVTDALDPDSCRTRTTGRATHTRERHIVLIAELTPILFRVRSSQLLRTVMKLADRVTRDTTITKQQIDKNDSGTSLTIVRWRL